jgi:hypothetical protein
MDTALTRLRPRTISLLLVAVVAGGVLLAGCASGRSGTTNWTFGPGTPASPAPVAGASLGPAPTAIAVLPTASTPLPQGSPAVVTGTPKPFSGRMTPHVLLQDGYVSMYMNLENTGSEPLTFINTLYDTEPTKLYNPTVAFPWTNGTVALMTRQGRFFPSPAIVQPGARAVYIMGGLQANGSGQLDSPIANIKFCPTRGMDDVPSVPIQVTDLAWSTTDGVTTVRGTLAETEGTPRSDPPVVGVAFFDKGGAFVGAVVDGRNGARLQPNERRSFEMAGRGVISDRIVRAEAFAFVS